MAAKTLRELHEDVFGSDKFEIKQIEKGHPTKLLVFPRAIELVMVLPGKLAKEVRQQFATVIQRYMAGDLTLVEEIQANAQSTAPVAQMARESLGIVSEADLKLKRRWEEVEVDRAETEAKRLKFEMFNSFLSSIKDLDPTWQKDSRFVVQSKDYLKNVMFGPALAITDGAEVQESTLSISEVALKLGMGQLAHGELCMVGKRAKELYVAKHGRPPVQRKQFVDGAERLINSYTESDRALLVEALQTIH